MPPSSLYNSAGPSMYDGGVVSEGRSKASSNETNYDDLPPAQAGDGYSSPKQRIYFADWTRFMAISLVIFVHCLVNSADASGFDPDNDPGA